jgi:hypothetical protein
MTQTFHLIKDLPTYNDMAVAVFCYCAVTGKDMPNGLMETVEKINPQTLKEPYKTLLSGIKNSHYNDMDVIKVTFSSLLQTSLKEERKKNIDHVVVKTDWYENIDW